MRERSITPIEMEHTLHTIAEEAEVNTSRWPRRAPEGDPFRVRSERVRARRSFGLRVQARTLGVLAGELGPIAADMGRQPDLGPGCFGLGRDTLASIPFRACGSDFRLGSLGSNWAGKVGVCLMR